MIAAALDNDVLIKLSCYRLLQQLATAASGDVGVLGVARFVVRRRLRRDPRIRDASAATTEFDAFLAFAIQLEPTPEELELATVIEEAATSAALPVDTGESQLCAMAISREIGLLFSGDKRAIAAAQQLLPRLPALATLAGRLVCLEQAVLALVAHVGAAAVRSAVCMEPDIDTTITICCACHSSASPGDPSSGLISYIADLRRIAATLLHAQAAPI